MQGRKQGESEFVIDHRIISYWPTAMYTSSPLLTPDSAVGVLAFGYFIVHSWVSLFLSDGTLIDWAVSDNASKILRL